MLPTISVKDLQVGDVICSDHFANAYYPIEPDSKDPLLPVVSFEGKPFHGSPGTYLRGHAANDPERAKQWYVVVSVERITPGWKGGDYIANDGIRALAVGLNGSLKPDPEWFGRILINEDFKPHPLTAHVHYPSVTYWGRMDTMKGQIVYSLPN